MTSLRPLRIGARGSPLSLAQTGQFRDALAKAHPGRALDIIPISTTGDRIQDRRLIEAGGKGLFTKELDEALLDGRIDLAVHSMKDLPTQLPAGIVLACTPQRSATRPIRCSICRPRRKSARLACGVRPRCCRSAQASRS
jgi:hydroxymethylbilane synthase